MACFRIFSSEADNAINIVAACGKKLVVLSCTSSSVPASVSNKILFHVDDHEINCINVSHKGSLLAACTEGKNMIIWRLGGNKVEKVKQLLIHKRAINLQFTQSEEEVLIADKAGDVWKYGISDLEDSEGVLLLGHVSVLLDMVLVPSESFIITADRDEKIRVSHFPNSYNIHTLCLGHKELVSRVCLGSPHGNHLYSGSGDGSIYMWNYVSGVILDQYRFSEGPKDNCTVTGLSYSVNLNLLVASTDKSYRLFVFLIGQDAKMSLCCTFEMAAEICHFEFDPTNILWVLTASKEEPLTCLKWANTKLVRQSECYIDNLVSHVQDTNIYSDIDQHIISYEDFKKREFDNMSTYLQKKEERIAQKLTK